MGIGEPSKHYPTRMNTLVHLMAFMDGLLNTGKKLYLIDSCAMQSTFKFIPFVQTHLSKYGSQLTVIQSYFKDWPVIHFSPDFFKEKDFTTEKSIPFQALAGVYCAKEKKDFPPNLGVVYPSLAALSLEQLQYLSRVSLFKR
ncbi:MAG: hypothetical protein NTW08_01075 [Gammaproteobacteria bacterium]|nr:hypothetical protein [Gammaproteobacteria bacterium]